VGAGRLKTITYGKWFQRNTPRREFKEHLRSHVSITFDGVRHQARREAIAQDFAIVAIFQFDGTRSDEIGGKIPPPYPSPPGTVARVSEYRAGSIIYV
jgi:hypothetical protein